MSNRERSLIACIVLLVGVFGGTHGLAQSATATISGRVTDPSDAAVPGAQVNITKTATNITNTTQTNSEGLYVFPNLSPGRYRLTVSKEGFKTITKVGIVVHVQDSVAHNFALPLGSMTESITVRADGDAIPTSAAIGTVIDREFVDKLPLNGRSFQSLLLLVPGVVLTPATGPSGQFSVNGQRNSANYFTVDGVSANIGINPSSTIISQELAGALPGLTAFGTTQSLASIDELAEFKVQTSSYSAELGRQPGGQIQLVTRSGENQIHGTAAEYLRNDVFDARNWFNMKPNPKPPLRQNQFGGTFSGPVILPKVYDGRNRTFFFFSYEGLRLLLPTSSTFFVPSLRLRQGAPAALQPILNAFSVPTGPERMVDDDFDPTTPDVPSGVAPIAANYSSPSNMDATGIRLDHSVGSRLHLFGRYKETRSDNLIRTLNVLTGNKNVLRTLTLGTTFSFTPRLFNEFRFNYTSNRGRNSSGIDDFGGAAPVDFSTLVSGFSGPGLKRASYTLAFGGLIPPLSAGDQQDSFQRQINIVNNVSLTRGVHHFRFGVDYRRLAPIFGPVEYESNALFFSQNDVLNGIVSFLSIGARQKVRPIFDNFSAYFQDAWSISSRLTLNLGLRWELNPAPHDANGLKPVLVVGVEDLPTATLASPDAPFYNTSYGAFAPRVGVAYRLRNSSGWETVLRGGFGIYHDLGNGLATVGFLLFPFRATRIMFGVPYPVSPALAQPPAFPPVQLPLTQPVSALNPDLKLPYTMQWSLGVEQSLGQLNKLEISYVASAARNLITSTALNNPAGGFGPRPNPNFRAINYARNGSTADYQALQVEYRIFPRERGLQALLGYTWSHAIDEVSLEGFSGILERGNADFDVRHKFTLGAVYDIPKLAAGPILTAVFRNWAVDSTFYAQSSPPLDLRADGSLFSTDDGRLIEARPDVIPGVPLWIEDPAVPGGQRLNPAGFANPPVDPNDPFGFFFARQGTLGRNVVRPPALFQWNMALRRQVNFSERLNLQFKWEAFNVLNHPLFGGYDRNFFPGTTSLGVPTTTLNTSLGGLNPLYQLGGARSMQFSLRLAF